MSDTVCNNCAVAYLLKDVAPHIKRGHRYAEKQPEGKVARFVDLTLPKHVADKLLELDKHCKDNDVY